MYKNKNNITNKGIGNKLASSKLALFSISFIFLFFLSISLAYAQGVTINNNYTQYLPTLKGVVISQGSGSSVNNNTFNVNNSNFWQGWTPQTYNASFIQPYSRWFYNQTLSALTILNQTQCPAGNYSYGVQQNGTWLCRSDNTGSSSGGGNISGGGAITQIPYFEDTNTIYGNSTFTFNKTNGRVTADRVSATNFFETFGKNNVRFNQNTFLLNYNMKASRISGTNFNGGYDYCQVVPLKSGWNAFGIMNNINKTYTNKTISLITGLTSIGYSSNINYPISRVKYTYNGGASSCYYGNASCGGVLINITTAEDGSNPSSRTPLNRFHPNDGLWVEVNEDSSITFENIEGSDTGLVDQTDQIQSLLIQDTISGQIYNMSYATATLRWIGVTSSVNSMVNYFDPEEGYVQVTPAGRLNAWRGYFIYANVDNINLVVNSTECLAKSYVGSTIAKDGIYTNNIYYINGTPYNFSTGGSSGSGFFNASYVYTNGTGIRLNNNQFNLSKEYTDALYASIIYGYNQTNATLYLLNQSICPAGNYSYGIQGNGTLLCRSDNSGGGSPSVTPLAGRTLFASSQCNALTCTINTNADDILVVNAKGDVNGSLARQFLNLTINEVLSDQASYKQAAVIDTTGFTLVNVSQVSGGVYSANISVSAGIISNPSITMMLYRSENATIYVNNITINTTLTNVAFTNRSENWGVNNLTANWFFGKFNIALSLGRLFSFSSFNGTTLDLEHNSTFLNDTIAAYGNRVGFNNTRNIFDQDLNKTSNVLFGNITNNGNLTQKGNITMLSGSAQIWATGRYTYDNGTCMVHQGLTSRLEIC